MCGIRVCNHRIFGLEKYVSSNSRERNYDLIGPIFYVHILSFALRLQTRDWSTP